MTIDEKIEAAWEQHCGDAELNPNLFPEKREAFSEGYRAALRGCFSVIEPENAWILYTTFGLLNGVWHRLSGSGATRMQIESGECVSLKKFERIVKLNIPHPSEVFSEEVNHG